MVTPLNILYYSLAVGFLTLVGFLCYTLYHLTDDLKILKNILVNVRNVSNDIDVLENQIKTSIISLLSLFLKKGGELYGKKK